MAIDILGGLRDLAGRMPDWWQDLARSQAEDGFGMSGEEFLRPLSWYGAGPLGGILFEDVQALRRAEPAAADAASDYEDPAMRALDGPVMPTEPELTYPFPMLPGDSVAQAQQDAVEELAGLETEYETRLSALQDMYQLAETPAEKAMLQFELENLEAQREAGQKVVANAYGSAIKGSAKQARGARRRARKDGDRAEQRFRRSADQAGEFVASGEEAFADSGYGIGPGGVSGGAADILGELNRQAAVEGNAAEGRGLVAADEIAFLGEAMRGEQAAQQGELERLAAALSAQSQMAHAQQVNDRIAQERAAMAGAQMDLSNMFTQRSFGLQDQARAMGAQQDSAYADAYNQWSQNQFELDAAREARDYESNLAEYLRQRQVEQARSLNDLTDEEFEDLLNRSARGQALGLDPSIFLP